MFRRNGFALIESLLMISVISCCMPLIVSCIRCIATLDYSKPFMQRYNQIYQLRQDLNEASEVFLEQGTLFYVSDQLYQIYFVNDKVIRTPGTVIYFADIQNCEFYQDNNHINMILHFEEGEEEWMIGYVK